MTKKNGWGSYNEDKHNEYEDVIDLDTGDRVRGKEKTKNRSKEVFEMFDNYPLDWLKNSTQRNAANSLVESKGFDTVKDMVDLSKKWETDKFCPRVRSPHELSMKWEKLVDYKKGRDKPRVYVV